MNPPSLPPATPQRAPGPRTGLAIASLVLGILGFVSSFVIVGIVFSLLGFILGIAHLLRRQTRNGMAWAGLLLSVIGIVISVAMGAFCFKLVTSPGFQAKIKKLVENVDRSAPAVSDDGFGEWLGVVAPDFSVTTLDDQTIKLSDLKGKRVVLDFWATWCPPCVQEIPHFIKLRDEASEDDLVIVGISSEDAATLKSFVKKKGINYPIASADDLPAPYKNVSGIPTTFFIDRKGIIQNVFVGYHEFDVLKKHAQGNDFEGEPKTSPDEGTAPADTTP
jgi:peroxiredoxin